MIKSNYAYILGLTVAVAVQSHCFAVEKSVDELLDQANKLRRAVARARERIARGEVDDVMIKVPFRNNEMVTMDEAERLADQYEKMAFELHIQSVKPAADTPLTSAQIQKLVAGISTIKVPPPIPPGEASVRFGQIPDDDIKSAMVLLGMDMGTAVIDVTGRVAGRTLLPLKAIIVSGKIFIAAEDGADVYLTKKMEIYEAALTYLRKPATARKFTAIVRVLKEKKPLPEDADITMVRAAQAISNPNLGGHTSRLVWNALTSPEARNAALTRATLEAYGFIIGDATKKTVNSILVQRSSEYRKAADFVQRVTPYWKKTQIEAQKVPLSVAIEHANEVMAGAFTTYEPLGKAAGTINAFYRGEVFGKLLRSKKLDRHETNSAKISTPIK